MVKKFLSYEIIAIIKKEILDASRDRRTIFAMIVLPMIIIPVFTVLPLYLVSPTTNPSTVRILNEDTNSYGKNLADLLVKTEGLTVSSATPSEGLNLTKDVESGKYDIGVHIPRTFSTQIGSNLTAIVYIVYDQTNMRSSTGAGLVMATVANYSQSIAAIRLTAKNVTSSDINPVQVAPLTIKAVNPAQQMASIILPMMIVIYGFSGGMYFAIDITAGEKERKTLEALLTMPPTRSQIVAGKYLALVLMTVLSTSLAIIGVIIGINFETELLGAGTFTLTTQTLAVIAITMLLSSMSAGALEMFVAIFARSYKEAQNYVSPLMLVFILPIYLVSFAPASIYALLIPVVNFVIILQHAILGTLTTTELLMGLASGVVYIVIFLLLAIKAFKNEKVIFRGT